ncbi:MAG: peroxidase-related enzyme [Balneolaceae bacterium]|nr:peroxidase-related enzyme [Balneolaceae bacterium]MCH8549915.1 peroxidase-related enzyme [Balneolaceae bacterium]
MAHIKTIAPEESDGRLSEVYDHLTETRGKIAEVHKIQSLNPEALMAHMELYMTIMFGKSPLKRYQREMLGVVTSAANRCEYCINHHLEALLAYWKDEEKARLLVRNRSEIDLSQTDQMLCDLAEKLTLNHNPDYSDDIVAFQKAGLDDRAILDAVQIIAYFNFVNRMVLGLGVEFSEEEMKGYRY